jgi:flagellar hook-associated protein 1 FlgK
MSLLSFLSIARSALLAQQRAMDVTAHNVANARTPGYSRQRLNLTPADPLLTAYGPIGRGVTDQGIMRARNRFLDAAYRNEAGLFARANTTLDYLGQLESVMDEPSDTSLRAALDGLFQAFADLSNDPSSGLQRNLVRDGANRLIQQFHRISGEIRRSTDEALSQMNADVAELNRLTAEIAKLNQRILVARGASTGAADLEDQRDVLLDRLSQLAGIRVLERDNGSVGVLAGGLLLVDGGWSQTFQAASSPKTGGWVIEVVPMGGGGIPTGMSTMSGSGTATLDPGGGSLGSVLDLLNTTLPDLGSELDRLAQAVVEEINAVHRTGYTLTGATGVDFFDPAGVTAATIGLSADVAASGDAIAAAGVPTAGDGAIALLLAGLSEQAIATLGGRTLGSFYIELTATLGSAVRRAGEDVDTQQILVDRVDLQRASVSGVSVDEEMAILIGQQQAYTAAAHLIKVAQDMMDDVLNMV